MRKSTPGPWKVEGDADSDDALTITADGRDGKVGIATIDIGFDEPFESEQLTNAKLIAAAPAMWAALREIAEADGSGEYALRTMARSALDRLS